MSQLLVNFSGVVAVLIAVAVVMDPWGPHCELWCTRNSFWQLWSYLSLNYKWLTAARIYFPQWWGLPGPHGHAHRVRVSRGPLRAWDSPSSRCNPTPVEVETHAQGTFHERLMPFCRLCHHGLIMHRRPHLKYLCMKNQVSTKEFWAGHTYSAHWGKYARTDRDYTAGSQTSRYLQWTEVNLKIWCPVIYMC